MMNEALVVFVRSVIAFITLLIFARILGKQQGSQLTFFEYVLGITIGSTASTLTTDLTSRAWPHWVGLLTWALAVLIIQWASLKWRHAAKYFNGEPTIVVMNGRIMEKTLGSMRYTADDLMEQLRNNGVFDLNEVAYAMLEPNGELSVLKKSQYQPVTINDLNISPNFVGVSTELIYDGVIQEQNLQQIKRNRRWLDSRLKAHGIVSPSEVFLATIDPHGNLYIDTYKDQVKITDPGDYPGPS
jgi:uncharacterized membrane protein YcaP (DUF421 family)